MVLQPWGLTQQTVGSGLARISHGLSLREAVSAVLARRRDRGPRRLLVFGWEGFHAKAHRRRGRQRDGDRGRAGWMHQEPSVVLLFLFRLCLLFCASAPPRENLRRQPEENQPRVNDDAASFPEPRRGGGVWPGMPTPGWEPENTGAPEGAKESSWLAYAIVPGS